MKAKYISYQDTHSFSKLVLDYVNDVEFLKSFYSFRPDIDGLKKAVDAHQFTGDRATLVKVLQQQYQSIKVNQAVSSNIDLLANDNTYTVTTGHQLNLFTGPLYFIYKIVTTINLALELKIAYPEKNFVPVYWMATEDHDFEEINHVSLDEKNISWIQQTNGATGRLSTKTVAAAVQAYKGYLGISKNGKKLGKLVEKAYLENENLADATRVLVNSLFEQYGLIIINADDASLKEQFAEIIKSDITQQNSARLTEQTSKTLEENGYKTQVNGRDINFFYLKENLRERIIKEGDLYTVNHTEIKFTAAEILTEIEQHPERFSPNVIMRPLYQEVILPNVAYIGGGAEVSYWMQLKANFDFYKVNFPVLLLRNSALVIDRRSFANLHKLGFNFEDIFLSTEALQEKWINANSDADICLTDEKANIKAVFDKIKLNAFKIDKTLEVSAEAVLVKTEKLLDKLEKKFFRAEKRNHEVSITQIENLKKRLFPGGTLQERVANLAPMYVEYGDDFIASLIENFEPLGGDFTVILP